MGFRKKERRAGSNENLISSVPHNKYVLSTLGCMSKRGVACAWRFRSITLIVILDTCYIPGCLQRNDHWKLSNQTNPSTEETSYSRFPVVSCRLSAFTKDLDDLV